MPSKRIIVTLPEKDKLWLEGYSKAYKVSVAEAIRRGIDKLKNAATGESYHRIVQNTKGIWKKGDGLEYQIDIRSEWHVP
jgi:hypothetical protein